MSSAADAPQTPLNALDQTLISIFLSELPAQLKTLQENAQKGELNIQEILKTFQAISQGGKIVRLDLVVDSVKSFEQFFKQVEGKKELWNAEAKKQMQQLLKFLQELSTVSFKEIDVFLQTRSEEMRELIRKIQQPSSTAPTAPLKAFEEKKGTDSTQDLFFDTTLFELFRNELDMQTKALDQGLIDLEKNPKDGALLETLMRAAHSIKGAARVVAISPIVRLSHSMEDCFVAAQKQQLEIAGDKVDQLLRGVDLLKRLSMVKLEELNGWMSEELPGIEALIQELAAATTPRSPPNEEKKSIKKLEMQEVAQAPTSVAAKLLGKEGPKKVETPSLRTTFAKDRVLRITAQNLNHLMGLAGESLVESRWLYPFGENLQKIKVDFKKMSDTLDLLRDSVRTVEIKEEAQNALIALHDQLNLIYGGITERLAELDSFIRRHASLSDRLYQEVINSRMRPFRDGVEGFPRMVRDVARQLGKEVKLEIDGKSTPVDRDILEKLESPLSHLIRNAIDHGIESPQDRIAAGKPSEGLIKVEAGHRGGMLSIVVSDDGRGLDIEKLRTKIVEKNLTHADLAQRLTDSEVIDFLFLPGFSTAQTVSEISGRGVGLNVVQEVLQEVGGSIRTTFTPGLGMSFHLRLPLTLSVIRALLVEISGEPYALPSARIDQAFLVDREQIQSIGKRQFVNYEGENIGLISAWQVLELAEPQLKSAKLPVILMSDLTNSYGLVVDRLIGEKELVVQELDARLGKIPDISAGSFLEDGSPILIIDVEDMVRSIDNLLSGGRLTQVEESIEKPLKKAKKKRILVVDDSITVREVECRLLKNQGYEVETAVNGVDGWNAVRMGNYDLVVSDVDMPRMNGIELLKAIKHDRKLKRTPVMIVSYKSSEEDRLKGLEAGADYYLTKSSFHDTTLIDAVADLIGKSE